MLRSRIIIRLFAVMLAALMIAGVVSACSSGPAPGENTAAPVETDAPEEPKAALFAHWKLQNVDGCYTGSVDDDTVGFKDLTGNGNDLVAKTVGNGDQLDIFSWDTDVDASAQNFKSGLKMDNTKVKAASVDTYKASETSYTGGYTSGKYLETVKDAPINSYEFEEGFSIEFIFKLSADLDLEYNRYAGIFSRQGVLETNNEPPFSVAVTEWETEKGGKLLGDHETWLQLLVMGDYNGINEEMNEKLLKAGEWHHVLVTQDELCYITVYVDGEELYRAYNQARRIMCTDPSFSWEVGVGRKSAAGHSGDSKNPDDPAGMIRRLFAGSIAEIRMFKGAIDVSDSLYATEFNASK